MVSEHAPGMPEQVGRSIGAIGQRQAALSTRHIAAADADRALTDALAEAHAASAEAVRRLDGIAAEIDDAVANQAALALDTAMGAREFQKFLIAKQREISAVVSNAREIGEAKKAVLDTLREHYTGSAG
jgi:predicted component of type VI protein secretion system